MLRNYNDNINNLNGPPSWLGIFFVISKGRMSLVASLLRWERPPVPWLLPLVQGLQFLWTAEETEETIKTSVSIESHFFGWRKICNKSRGELSVVALTSQHQVVEEVFPMERQGTVARHLATGKRGCGFGSPKDMAGISKGYDVDPPAILRFFSH